MDDSPTLKSFQEHQQKKRSKKLLLAIMKREQITNVIVVGNENIIPTYYVDTKFDSKTPSDLYYGLFGGPEDRLPDVFIARIAVENKAEAKELFHENKRPQWVNFIKSYDGSCI